MKYRVAVALILTPIGVKAQTSEAPAKAVESPTKEKKICRSMTPTGSFMATRVCNSAARGANLMRLLPTARSRPGMSIECLRPACRTELDEEGPEFGA
jgi:hypothetical protein